MKYIVKKNKEQLLGIKYKRKSKNIMGSMTQECEKFRLTNATYIDMFHKDLLDKGLKAKIIEKHYNNVNFYLNVYLLREDVV